jgi:hypothetical protein
LTKNKINISGQNLDAEINITNIVNGLGTHNILNSPGSIDGLNSPFSTSPMSIGSNIGYKLQKKFGPNIETVDTPSRTFLPFRFHVYDTNKEI